MKKGLRVLSLFDGISCGQIALQRAELPVEIYFASEIDKHAIKITQKNYPKTIQMGDVKNIYFESLGQIDLLIGGSPCQDLSIAKKNRQGLEGERSGLFFKYVEALKITKPKYFLLENVASMKKADRDVISEILGVEPIMINSALVSAQQRKRYYWTNIPNIEQPEDKKILLKDILESGYANTDKAYCLTTRYSGASFPHDFLKKKKSFVAETAILQIPRGKNNGGIYSEKSPTLTANSWEHNNKVIELSSVLYSQYNQAIHLEKSASIGTTPQNATSISGQIVVTPIRIGQIGAGGQGQRIYSVMGKNVSLNANGGGQGAKTGLYKIDLPDGNYSIRKLTPIECERLQTLPDNYTEGISNSQRYKSIGNGWTVDVIAHIFKFLKQELEKGEKTNGKTI